MSLACELVSEICIPKLSYLEGSIEKLNKREKKNATVALLQKICSKALGQGLFQSSWNYCSAQPGAGWSDKTYGTLFLRERICLKRPS